MSARRRQPTSSTRAGRRRSATPPDDFPHNLPVELTPFVGREREMEEILALLSDPDVRLVTLVGLGGSGKTRLALQAAPSAWSLFPDGCWFVSLAPLSSVELLPDAVASALDLHSIVGVVRKAQVLSYLEDKQLVLILDNLEHLLPEATSFLKEILEFDGSVKILATSRERLSTPGEWVYSLGGLAYPQEVGLDEPQSFEALDLFVQQLRQGGASVTTADMPAAARVCRRVEGMPLALILAAGWGRTLTCAQIAEEIEQSMTILESQKVALPEKHRSMKAVFDHSWKLLSEGERSVLRKLSVFRGGFDREAAADVAEADLATLGALVDRSLIERNAEGRFSMHFLVRQYLHERLIQAGEYGSTRDAHLRYFQELAQKAEPWLRSQEQAAWFDRLEREHNNLRAALDWSFTSQPADGPTERFKLGVALALSLWWFWRVRGYLEEGRQRYATCLQTHFEELPIRIQTYVSLYLCDLEWLRSNAKIALPLSEQGISLAMRNEDKEGLAIGLLLNGSVLSEIDPDLSREKLEQSLVLLRELEDSFFSAGALYLLSELAYYVSESPEDAQDLCAQSIELALRSGNTQLASHALSSSGRMSRSQGEYQRAKESYEEAYRIAEEIKNARGIYRSLQGLACLHLDRGELIQAEQYFSASSQYAKVLGWEGQLDEADFARVQGDLHECEIICRNGLERAKNIGIDVFISDWLDRSGLLALSRQEPVTALTHHREALARGQLSRVRNSYWRSGILAGTAMSLAANNQLQKAVLLFSAVDRFLKSRGYVLTAGRQGEVDRWLAFAQERLSQSKFADAWEQGGRIELDEAVEYALSEELEPKPSPAEAARPHGLTPREVEVLRLVAHGLTDAEVAEKLVISRRTVNAHLTSIYSKLEVNSRAAATRFAFEHNLV